MYVRHDLTMEHFFPKLLHLYQTRLLHLHYTMHSDMLKCVERSREPSKRTAVQRPEDPVEDFACPDYITHRNTVTVLTLLRYGHVYKEKCS